MPGLVNRIFMFAMSCEVSPGKARGAVIISSDVLEELINASVKGSM